MGNQRFEQATGKRESIEQQYKDAGIVESIDSRELSPEQKEPFPVEIGTKKDGNEDPDHQEQRERDDKEQEIYKRYRDLLGKYKSVWAEIKKIERRYRMVLQDPEIASSIRVLDQERHNIHLEAISTAAQIGIGKHDVLADILLNEGNLGEFGLPEVAVFRDTSTLNNDRIEPGYSYLVIDITNALDGNFKPDPLPEIPSLYSSILSKRSLEIRHQLNIREIYEQNFPNGFFHDTSEIVNCLAVPNDRLEEVAACIRNHPEFRFDSKFFSEEELREARLTFESQVTAFLKEHVKDNREMADDLLKKYQSNGNQDEIEIAQRLVKEHFNT